MPGITADCTRSWVAQGDYFYVIKSGNFAVSKDAVAQDQYGSPMAELGEDGTPQARNRRPSMKVKSSASKAMKEDGKVVLSVLNPPDCFGMSATSQRVANLH